MQQPPFGQSSMQSIKGAGTLDKLRKTTPVFNGTSLLPKGLTPPKRGQVTMRRIKDSKRNDKLANANTDSSITSLHTCLQEPWYA